MPKMTVRHKVLALIKKQRTSTAKEISDVLKMSAASVRHHLSILRSDGRIVEISVRHPRGRGRPIKVFRLSEKSLGDNLPLLTDTLLTNLGMTKAISKRQRVHRSIAIEIANQIGRTNPNDPIAKRLGILLEKLNVLHYQSGWEAGAEGPRILFGHCPYAAVIERHPELCQIDGYLVGEEIGGKVRQLAKIDQKPGGITHCIFQIS
jgi:predicted ArsR family transcriptional regulator